MLTWCPVALHEWMNERNDETVVGDMSTATGADGPLVYSIIRWHGPGRRCTILLLVGVGGPTRELHDASESAFILYSGIANRHTVASVSRTFVLAVFFYFIVSESTETESFSYIFILSKECQHVLHTRHWCAWYAMHTCSRGGASPNHTLGWRRLGIKTRFFYDYMH